MKSQPGFGTSRAPTRSPISRAHMVSIRRSWLSDLEQAIPNRSFTRFRRTPDDISDACTLQYFGRCIPHLQEHAIKRAMVGIGDNEAPELVGIAKRRKRAVHQSNNFAEHDFSWRSPQPVAAFRTANALHDARVLEL